MLGMIDEMLRQRMFQYAERLRDLLIEIDPMALNDIIRTAEMIENEKIAAIDKNHLSVWSAMVEVLGLHEFLTLYYSLEHKRFAKGEILVNQGSRDAVLYFVNSGRVDLFFQEKGKDVLIKTVGAGEILGAGTIFEASTWTFTVRSLGAEVSLLKPDSLQKWQKDYPGLESKLSDFCVRFKVPHESFRKMGRDRRVFQRVQIAGRVEMVLLEGKGTRIGAKGDLFDISAGGVSFSLRISQKNNARLLFGRKVGLSLTSAGSSRLSITGVILALRSQPAIGNEYSVSVQFNRQLTQKELKDLIVSAQGKEKTGSAEKSPNSPGAMPTSLRGK